MSEMTVMHSCTPIHATRASPPRAENEDKRMGKGCVVENWRRGSASRPGGLVKMNNTSGVWDFPTLPSDRTLIRM